MVKLDSPMQHNLLLLVAVAVAFVLSPCPKMFRSAICHSDFKSNTTPVVPVLDKNGNLLAYQVVRRFGGGRVVGIGRVGHATKEDSDGRVGRVGRATEEDDDGRVGRVGCVGDDFVGTGRVGRIGRATEEDDGGRVGRVGRATNDEGCVGRVGRVNVCVGHASGHVALADCIGLANTADGRIDEDHFSQSNAVFRQLESSGEPYRRRRIGAAEG